MKTINEIDDNCWIFNIILMYVIEYSELTNLIIDLDS